MKLRNAAVLACGLFLGSGCGISRLISPTEKFHADPHFQTDPRFGDRPANYVPVKKTIEQMVDATPTVYIELEVNVGNWLGVGGDNLVTASGIVVKYSGRPYILSAGHITMDSVTDIKSVYVYFPGSNLPPEEVEVVAYDTLLDFSWLRFKNDKFRPDKPYPVIGRSSELRPGQKLVALGSPLGMRHSVTDGVVMNTNTGRYNFSVPQPQLIMHNVTGNPGSSGCAILNEYGELVGIFTGAFVGPPTPMPYAVPIDDIVSVMRQLEHPGEISHPQPQFRVYNTWEWSPADFKHREIAPPPLAGVFVTSDESPKNNSHSESNYKPVWTGLLKGDVILEVNGFKIENAIQFWKYLLLDCHAGQTVDFKINRYGKEMTVQMKLK